MEIAQAFEDVKYEELLIILLQNQPELAECFLISIVFIFSLISKF